MKSNRKELEQKLEKNIEKAKASVQLLEISQSMSDKKKSEIEKINNRLLIAAEKRARAEFREEVIQKLIFLKKKELDSFGETKAQRKRRMHLFMTIGGMYAKYQFLDKNLVRTMLQCVRSTSEYNKLKSEIIEFFPKAMEKYQYLQDEIKTVPKFLEEKNAKKQAKPKMALETNLATEVQ